MTIINAMRFDRYSGAMVCDEERTLIDLNRKLASVDKIQSVVPEEIEKDQGIVAAIGNTGTCSVGEQIHKKTFFSLKEEYKKEIERLGKKPTQFKTIEDIAYIAYDIMIEIKHRHINEMLLSKFGFNTSDFIRTYYNHNGTRIDIKDSKVISEAMKYITAQSRTPEIDKIFVNMSILCGYDEKFGFQIFHLSMFQQTCEPINAIFNSDGSGRDVSNIVFLEFANKKSYLERQTSVDRVEGLITLIHATNLSSKINIGVGGYFNIVYIDGRRPPCNGRIEHICNERAKLASEIVYAYTSELISKENTYNLIDSLIFKKDPFDEVNEKMWRYCNDQLTLWKLLRKYKQG